MSKPLPRYEVELRHGAEVVFRGLAVSVTGAEGVLPAIRFGGSVYLHRDGVIGSGSGPTRYVYEWAPHAQVEIGDALAAGEAGAAH